MNEIVGVPAKLNSSCHPSIHQFVLGKHQVSERISTHVQHYLINQVAQQFSLQLCHGGWCNISTCFPTCFPHNCNFPVFNNFTKQYALRFTAVLSEYRRIFLTNLSSQKVMIEAEFQRFLPRFPHKCLTFSYSGTPEIFQPFKPSQQ